MVHIRQGNPPIGRRILERFLTGLNREGFPAG
jgi:hypothetical protein